MREPLDGSMSFSLIWTALAIAGIVLGWLWLERPIRYRRQTFADLERFLGDWSDSGGDGFQIHIESRKPKVDLIATLRGEGSAKQLVVPIGAISEGAWPEIEALAEQFVGVVVSEQELRLPGRAPYTGSVAARAAKTILAESGCKPDAHFTVFADPHSFDPHYAAELYERVSDTGDGPIQRWSRRSAKALRAEIRRKSKK